MGAPCNVEAVAFLVTVAARKPRARQAALDSLARASQWLAIIYNML